MNGNKIMGSYLNVLNGVLFDERYPAIMMPKQHPPKFKCETNKLRAWLESFGFFPALENKIDLDITGAQTVTSRRSEWVCTKLK